MKSGIVPLDDKYGAGYYLIIDVDDQGYHRCRFMVGCWWPAGKWSEVILEETPKRRDCKICEKYAEEIRKHFVSAL